jgi:hypothetical protein
MFSEGGSGNWRANEDKIRRCKWIVAARNRHTDWSEGDEEHGSAFLIGSIVGVKSSEYKKQLDRLVIVFNRYAKLDKPKVWPNNHRNPVAYTNLKALGIDEGQLKWKDFPEKLQPAGTPHTGNEDENQSPSFVLEKVKLMIARSLSIDPSAITISIRV